MREGGDDYSRRGGGEGREEGGGGGRREEGGGRDLGHEFGEVVEAVVDAPQVGVDAVVFASIPQPLPACVVHQVLPHGRLEAREQRRHLHGRHQHRALEDKQERRSQPPF